MTTRWTDQLFAQGELVYRIGRDGDDYVADWPGLLELRMKRGETEPRIVPSADADAAFVEKVRNGFLAGLVFHLQGGLALHASSVALGERAVAFVGDSCSGKSTTAAAVVRSAKAVLLADDATLIEWKGATPMIRQTESTSWLRPDAALAFGLEPTEDKTPRRPSAPASHLPEGTPLATLIVLRFDDAAPPLGALRALRGIEMVRSLLPSVIRWDTDSSARAEEEIRALSQVVDLVSVYEFARPRALDLLERQIDAMLRSLVLPPSNLPEPE